MVVPLFPKSLAVAAAVVSLLIPTLAEAQTKNITGSNPTTAEAKHLDLVNKSGRQRMLSQRVAKAYYQLVLNQQPEKARDALTRAMQDLRAAQAELKGGVGNDLAPMVAEQAGLIEQLATAVVAPASATAAPLVDKAANTLLDNAERLTEAIQKSRGSTKAGLLNLAARQRMLSQRMAKEFFLYQITRAPAAKASLQQASQEFSMALGAFDLHKTEFPGVAGQINSAKIQMLFLEDAIRSYESPTPQQLASVSIASEYIHDEMNALVGAVQKVMDNR